MSGKKVRHGVSASPLPSSHVEDVDRDIRHAVDDALREHDRAGNTVPILHNGKVVQVSPKEILSREETSTARVFHADLFGSRKEKYAKLAEQKFTDVPWTEAAPSGPFYLFVPQNNDVREEYEQGWSVTEVFPTYSLGLNSHRDDFAVAFELLPLKKRVADMASQLLTDENLREKYGLKDTTDFSVSKARSSLRKPVTLVPSLYRPFDIRYLLYNSSVLDRPREDVNRNIVEKTNLCLITTRQTRESFAALATDLVCSQHKIVSVYDGSFVFPLYIYPTAQEKEFGIEKHANLAPGFVTALAERLGHAAMAGDTFHYIYAILYSPAYRERYGEFLKRDFPRIPLPPDADTFALGAAVGKNLVAAHLLEDPTLLASAPGFPHSGTNMVDKMKPDKRYHDGKIHLNDAQYFDAVSPDVWNFRVGGYQPAAKWLDDRAGRALSDADLTHYRKLLAAQQATLALLPAADAVFAHVLNT